MVISKTPLRISFTGGGTDLPSFYRFNDYGAVVSTSIDSYIYVTVKEHSKLFIENIRLNYSDVELVDTIDEIKNPIIRECLRFTDIKNNLYISTIADCPGSSGLGSSSAFCVGLLNALYRLKNIPVSSGRLAEEAAHIEIDVLQRPIGKQDHYATAFGGLNYFRFNSDESVTIIPISLEKNNIRTIFPNMLSFWTTVTRPAESILEQQDKRNHQNKEMLLKMRSQADAMQLALLKDELTLERFGEIIHDGWVMKRLLAPGITNSAIDNCYETARSLGAFGGKISGAGGGGFLNLFAPPEDHKALIQELSNKSLVPYKFNTDSLGTTVTKIY